VAAKSSKSGKVFRSGLPDERIDSATTARGDCSRSYGGCTHEEITRTEEGSREEEAKATLAVGYQSSESKPRGQVPRDNKKILDQL
jgi:hypothetical protein